MDAFIESLVTLSTVDGIMALLTLTVLEIVLGIDNLVFISILVGRAPKKNQRMIRLTGMILAMVFRIVLLFCITWIIGLKEVVFQIGDLGFSWKDLILLAGGIFLLTKSVFEIHHKLTPGEDEEAKKPKSKGGSVVMMMVLQVVVIDLVFSIDSILTAVGLTREIGIMVIAVVLSMAFMLLFAKAVGDFINKNPTIVMLALAFLVSIALLLILEGFHQGEKIERGYIYFAMAFAFTVEMLNLRVRRKKKATRDAENAAEGAETSSDSIAEEVTEETLSQKEEALKAKEAELAKKEAALSKREAELQKQSESKTDDEEDSDKTES